MAKHKTKTSPVSLGRTDLTGLGNRSDRSDRCQPFWAPQHLNLSLTPSPEHMPSPSSLSLPPELPPPQTLTPKFLTPNPFQGLGSFKSESRIILSMSSSPG